MEAKNKMILYAVVAVIALLLVWRVVRFLFKWALIGAVVGGAAYFTYNYLLPKRNED